MARRLAIARPKLTQIVLNRSQPGLPRSSSSSSPVFGRARGWSWPMSARHRWPKKDKRRWRIVSDRSSCPVRDRTTSLETKSVQWIWRMRLRNCPVLYQRQLYHAVTLPWHLQFGLQRFCEVVTYDRHGHFAMTPASSEASRDKTAAPLWCKRHYSYTQCLCDCVRGRIGLLILLTGTK